MNYHQGTNLPEPHNPYDEQIGNENYYNEEYCDQEQVPSTSGTSQYLDVEIEETDELNFQFTTEQHIAR